MNYILIIGEIDGATQSHTTTEEEVVANVIYSLQVF